MPYSMNRGSRLRRIAMAMLGASGILLPAASGAFQWLPHASDAENDAIRYSAGIPNEAIAAKRAVEETVLSLAQESSRVAHTLAKKIAAREAVATAALQAADHRPLLEREVQPAAYLVVDAAEVLRVAAKAPDGVIEAIESTDPNWFCVGVQWHPEAETASALDVQIFDCFVQAAVRSLDGELVAA